MKEILTSYNVYNSIVEKAEGKYPNATLKELATEAYNYAIYCKKGGKFDEAETMALVNKYIPMEDEVIFREIWATITMYCFENAVFQMVNKHNTMENPESSANMCRYTVYACALLFEPERNKFVTYAMRSMENNINRENRSRFALRFPDKLIKEVQYIASHPEESPESIAEKFKVLTSKKVEVIRRALYAQNIISMDERFEGGDSDGDGGTIASILDSGEDMVSDFEENEIEQTILNEFIPIIARVYGADSAYCSLLRTGVLNGYESMSFYKMEAKYCVYLVTKKKLKNLGDEIPKYADLCTYCSYLYATQGRAGVEKYVKDTPEEYLIHNLLNEAVEEAKEILNSPNRSGNKCFKPAGSLNYMFSKVFPPKQAELSDSDKKQAARFRKELRDQGMDVIANALFAMSQTSQ